MVPKPSHSPSDVRKTPRGRRRTVTSDIVDETQLMERKQAVTVAAAMVTPSTGGTTPKGDNKKQTKKQTRARRTLFPSETDVSSRQRVSVVTPISGKRKVSDEDDEEKGHVSTQPSAKRRLIFGKYVDLIVCQPNVERVYKIVRKLTGSIGGNGYVGPIYGELTMGSMQKMTNLMMEYCDLNKESRFIDVGSGIGKPNLHVAQYPGVSFSCGVEVEQTRWALGMTCLKAVVDAAMEDAAEDSMLTSNSQIQGNTVFLHRDIMEAKTFDPFTHVYMFSIGFPPQLWIKLAKMWNSSKVSEHLICYHSPKNIIDCYGFDVELIAQTTTSMHGSKEGHMGYIYKRANPCLKRNLDHCDPLFRPSWELVKGGLGILHTSVTEEFDNMMGTGRQTRSSRR